MPSCFGVIGDPIAHSRSPAMHAAAFRALGLPHVYVPFQVPTAALERAIDGARALGLAGLNVTVPHKRAAMECVDEVTPEARRVGAINVICFADGWAVGHNTDGRGFLGALAELGAGRLRRATVLGSGGAARSVVDALVHAHPELELAWVARDPGTLPAVGERVHAHAWPELSTLPVPDLLVHATTVGMAGGPEAHPGPLHLERLAPGTFVVDVVYPRPEGGLLDRADALGMRTQDGLEMLVQQGALALELWLGAPVGREVVDAMRAAVRAG
jgi:shikimate dehydrogenase